MHRANDSSLIDAHRARFGSEPALITRSPGRVSLIGEHIDYSGGIVVPMGIDRCAWVSICRSDHSGQVRVHAMDLDETRIADLREYVASPPPAGDWSHYALGPIATVFDRIPADIGLDICFRCDVPSGAGLSSSAAIEVSSLRAVNQLLKLGLTPIEIARSCQIAENRYAGVPCGLMDQAASALAQPGQLLAFDCRDETGVVIEGIPGTSLVVLDSGVRHTLGDSAYRDRREAVESAAGKLGRSMRELAERDCQPDLNALSQNERQAATHAITEMLRVRDAIHAIKAKNVELFGDLLNASHASLRDILRVSCEEVDVIVNAAQITPGVYGARITGGGFGGCVIALCATDRATQAAQQICEQSGATQVLIHDW